MELVLQCPDIFDQKYSNKLKELIKFSPYKVLVILAHYSNFFNSMTDPWPMLDMLIQNSNSFMNPEVAVQYIALLTSICKRFPDYYEGRVKYCWTKICEALGSDDMNVLHSCYGALFTLSKLYKSGALPMECIKLHLRQKELVNKVLSVLANNPQTAIENRDSELLSLLFKIARTNEKASLLLMILAEDGSNAKVMINNCAWIKQPFPTYQHTFRLVNIVLKHKAFGKKIVAASSTIDLLVNLLDDCSIDIMQLMDFFFENIPLTSDMIQNLCEANFFSLLLDKINEFDSAITDTIMFNIYSIVANITYIKELDSIGEIACDEIIQEGELDILAGNVVIVLSKYDECLQILLDKNLDKFFQNHKKSPRIGHLAIQFLDTLKDVDIEDEGAEEEDFIEEEEEEGDDLNFEPEEEEEEEEDY